MRRTASLILVALSVGCATLPEPEDVGPAMARALESANAHLGAGRVDEAGYLLETMNAVDPGYDGLADAIAALPPEQRRFRDDPLLGINRARRVPTDRSLPAQVLLYLPDRVLDLLDVVSFDVHLGAGLFANVHFTRAVQLGAGFRTTGGLGWHERRSLGVQTQAESGVTVLGLGAEALAGWRAGTSGFAGVSEGLVGFHAPSDTTYQQFRDYWGVGASVTALLVGVDVDFHPVQLVDFAAGLLTIDFAHDDFASTRGLAFSDADEETLETLSEARAAGSTEAEE